LLEPQGSDGNLTEASGTGFVRRRSSDRHLEVEMLHRSSLAPTDRRDLPACPDHPGSLVRRYRSHGPAGPGVYPQCVPRGGEPAHLLAWTHERGPRRTAELPTLSPSEAAVLDDAADGLTVQESARRRRKSPETVKSQRKTLMVKLGARNIANAVAIAMRQRMLELERSA
jgi:DNA-binding CsgD family transcriptional regulator